MASAGPMNPSCRLRPYIGIATRGRPAVLREIVEAVREQALLPERIIISATGPDDVGDLAGRADLTVLYGPPGLARQRNAILDSLPPDAEFLAFFDDDFLPHPDWLMAAMAAFDAQPRAGALTGTVVADGILGPGLTLDQARTALQADRVTDATAVVKNYSPYGCNMAFRLSAVGPLRFDERLVLYGWLEDRDFGGGVAKAGYELLQVQACRGVHMGVKTGRVAGHRLGYSQVINPAYMHRKGTMTASAAIGQVSRNLAANLARSVRPEPFIDRRGRLRGNILALLDLCRGRLTPERAATL